MVSVDRVLELLADQRRRYALYCLEDRDEPISVDELAAAIARMERNSDEILDDHRNRIELLLQHTHLPMAEQTEFVEYDPAASTVQLTAEPPVLEELLTVAETVEEPL
ncbi:hypothetical protein [Natrinema sp. 1APR25-10V2]|uniref:DUF7344 domain-containing protein n=1 Tax=Natrinema sp. 1APR25-10V2 TaxID=2951081 RepID=UPI002876E479|nr:hypothetical protein [Natrinema sp. 1APR25-10V2]MDS0477852.1 hypothetical protein [Natrinema sp. 1APR25-10V2]